MKSITKQKPFDEVKQMLDGFSRVFVFGCGTCTTMTKTGGIDQVLEMNERLKAQGKIVTGHVVIAVACDEMAGAVLKENEKAIQSADCLLGMSCALGIQKVGTYLRRPVFPAVDTLFIGVEDIPGHFHEVCEQCGQCVLGDTAGICPIAYCHKSLVNGPCGGTNNGKCEVDKDSDCAWTLIYEKLKELGRLDLMRKYQPPRNHHVALKPRSTRVS